jgi:hypothetical protein
MVMPLLARGREDMTNMFYYGDNREVLRAHVADASVGLIYFDPPFNSSRQSAPQGDLP